MDNKITKKRLYEFLSYEWIMMLIVIVVAIFVGELIFTMAAVRLTTGQQFKYYYDLAIDGDNNGDFYSMLVDKDVFSYDILSVDTENITDKMDVLSIRLSVQEGDILFTDKAKPKDDATDKRIKVKTRIDASECRMYDFNELLADAETYLRDNFFIDALKEKDLATISYVKENIDQNKLEAVFNKRMAKDNRFRTQAQKEEGYKLERQRIERLCKEVTDFKYVMENGPEALFYRYTKFEQSLETAMSSERKDEQLITQLKEAIQNEKDCGRENAVYGFNLEALTGGEKNPSTYFKMRGKTTAEDVVVTVFGFKEFQPHLQYETLSFINAIVRECSNILG